MLLKLLFITILSSLILQATTYDLEKIKKDFHEEVVLKSLKKKFTKKSAIQRALKRRSEKFTLDEKYFAKAKKHLEKKQDKFTSSQFVTLVDLSKQVLILTLWDNEDKTFFPIGFDFISSGNINRELETTKGEDHYIKTPTGLFPIKSGWRSYGKSNENNTAKPYGKKGMFIFYFGEHKSIRYNTFDKDGNKIKDKKKWKLIKDNLKFAMHAHSTTQYLGKPRSHGCLRMSEELNLFLDNNLVFFKHLYKGEKWTHPYEEPPKEPKNYALAGKYLMVINNVF
ncbi:MAG: L,D-transpeptidase [Thiovulaceae bacterium]|nr:L,D-transpeptidase [Sulfurimonadaceae bacterium]